MRWTLFLQLLVAFSVLSMSDLRLAWLLLLVFDFFGKMMRPVIASNKLGAVS
jgi:hypothetical protein